MFDKVNVWPIVTQHIFTLYDVNTKKVKKGDLFLFYGAPVLFGVLAFFLISVKEESHIEPFISLFAIFSALLISAQVVLYTIYRSLEREHKVLKETIQSKNDNIITKRIGSRLGLVREANSNISYLILVCCVAIVVALVFIITAISRQLEDAVIVSLASHFVLSLLMVVKRVHVLFDSAYD